MTKSPKLPKGLRLVFVIWEDAYIDVNKDDTRKNVLEQIKPYLRYTPGLYVGETDTCVVLAGDCDYQDGEINFAEITQIPKVVVLHILDAQLPDFEHLP